tara:strand:+ start:4719 stop:5120 length:402 start_codon:yes stop_codon:yes gene_type:complete
MLKTGLIFCLIFGFTLSCETSYEQKIIGEWRLDSAYYHYNQFNFSSHGWHQEETYKYLPTGETITSAVNSSVSNKFSIEDKRLKYFDSNGELVNIYDILSIDGKNMVLRTDKKPIFKGKNQNRFEVRYFSKMN